MKQLYLSITLAFLILSPAIHGQTISSLAGAGDASNPSLPSPSSEPYRTIDETVLLSEAIPEFKLIKEGHTVRLIWVTAEVKEGDLFEVQFSEDGVQFENKARVEVEKDAFEEQFEVELGLHHTLNYYRIKGKGAGGVFYSSIKMVRKDLNELGYKVYPNPCNEYFVIEGHTNSNSYVRVFDLMGQTVYQQSFKGGEVSHHVEHELEAGTYSLRIVNDKDVQTKNIIVH